jgi:flagellin
MDDLVINGIKIRPTTTADDLFSSTASVSSNRSASAIAIANAINSQSTETGVRAIANGASSVGSITNTAVPASGNYTLYVNGTPINVAFVKDEPATVRRQKVADAINERTGQHGIKATDNGNGLSLTSDGRNMSVWFDSNVQDLSAASFGLDKGGSVAQVSRISVGGTVAATDTASVTINGVTITSAAAGGTTPTDLATKLEAAINAAITSNDTLKNISVARLNGNIEITSKVAGSPFELKGSSVVSTAATLGLSTVTANSMGKNDVTAIGSIPAQTIGGVTYPAQPVSGSTMAKTVYGTVRMLSDAALLPKTPAPGGAPPSDQLTKLNATGNAFTVTSGSDGFGPNSNFAVLGFQEGTFGGRSSEDMDPPKVGRLAFQVGASANQVVTIDLADFGKNGPITGEITGDVDLNVEQRTARISTSEGASDVLAKLDAVMDRVNATRATMGAVMNRLDHVVSNLTNVSMNLSASRSTIEDADYASASTELAKTQIMQQAATAVLAQANTSQQSVLKLLGG